MYMVSRCGFSSLDLSLKNCDACTPSSSSSRTVSCSNCVHVQSFPSNVPSIVTYLECFNCPRLTTIIPFNQIIGLLCYSCPLLKEIPNHHFEKLTLLNCKNCMLEKIPETLVALENLVCAQCPRLVNVPVFMNLKVLICSECPLLCEIPACPKLRNLDCSKCELITSIPSFPYLEDLNISNCSKIVSLDQYPVIVRLFCYNCSLITSFNHLTSLVNLYCNGCTLLTRLPKFLNERFPNLWQLDCISCPLLFAKIVIFSKCNGGSSFDPGDNFEARPRNGIASRFLVLFLNVKFPYAYELDTRALPRNHELYRPGGVEFLKIAEKYRNGIQK